MQFWDDLDSIPVDVQACLDSWRPLQDAGFEIATYGDQSAASYIAERFSPTHRQAFARCRHPAMRSDYFRLCYMTSSGGFYVDADDVLISAEWSDLFQDERLKVQPLCYDIPTGSMVPQNELWNPCSRDDDRIFYVNNNPLVAPPKHPILVAALERATTALIHWQGRFDIQSMTGPGNLTAALAAHAHALSEADVPQDFELIRGWDRVAETRWHLDYRSDARNWRNADWS